MLNGNEYTKLYSLLNIYRLKNELIFTIMDHQVVTPLRVDGKVRYIIGPLQKFSHQVLMKLLRLRLINLVNEIED